MKKNNFFSIVLPIYNVERYLDRCINSILNQEYANFEIILIDDGSPDNCPKMCDEWVEKDKRIKVVHKKNGGLGFARNTGIENAKGDYILFLDSDDYIEHNLLNNLNIEINKNQSDIIFFGYKRISSSGEELLNFSLKPESKVYIENNVIKNKLFNDFLISNSSKLFISAWNCCINLKFLKKSKVLFNSEREYISEDLDFHIRLFNFVNKLSFIEGTYYCYCQNDDSLTSTYKADRYERLKKFYIYMLEQKDKLKYDDQLNNGLMYSFISCVFGCIKMEVLHIENTSYSEGRKRIKYICNDEFFNKAYSMLDKKNMSFSWKVMRFLMKIKMYDLIIFFSKYKYKKNRI